MLAKKNKVPSITKQLLGWLMVPIITLCAVSAVTTFVRAINIATQAYDDALMECARELANRVCFTNGQLIMDLPPAALAVFKEDNIDKFYYAAFDDHGKCIAGDDEFIRSLSDKPNPMQKFQNGYIGKDEVRIAYLHTKVIGNEESKIRLYVAETVLKRQALINQILLAVVIPQLVLIPVAVLIVWLGVNRGLAPLKAVRDAIASRTQWDLRPVARVDAPQEIRPLVLSIDDLLSRLNKDIESQRRFVANAAHQLRTPLAGLSTQAELAMRQTDLNEIKRILKQVNRSASNVNRLVNQLLSLAKLEPNADNHLLSNDIDLNPLAKEATKDLVPFALDKEIDLGFEDSNKPAIVKGDEGSIRELIVNLIDNAIRYTQPGGRVTVRVEAKPHVTISVLDDGPGIPVNERERVFERFYRVLGNKVGGSGLGLAIVKEIAQVHRAEISLADGENGVGTLAKVSFRA